jgi:mRNA-degrading endonuclease YafQ of YafQ-DinJ toxin-antitoxin module
MNETERRLVSSPSFGRALKRHVGRDRKRLLCMVETLFQMVENPRHPMLETHALRGGKKDQLSCSCGYDCRIIFRIVPGSRPNTEDIILINVGTHDEVY